MYSPFTDDQGYSNLFANNPTTKMKHDLMMCIYEALQEEFENKHYSGNLKNTIDLSEQSADVTPLGDTGVNVQGASNFVITIQALRYDLKIYNETGQIVYTNTRTTGGSKSRQNSIIKRLKEGKTLAQIESEDAARGKLKKGGYENLLGGSYADAVDETGGFSGTHKDYVEKCIRKGIAKWQQMYPDLDISSNL